MKPALKLLTSTLLVAGLLLLAADSARTGLTYSRASQGHGPAVTAETPPGAPLRISSFRLDLTNLKAPEIVVEVVNMTDKPIRAYTVREDVMVGGNTVGCSTMTSDVYDTDAVIRPRHFATVSLSHVSSGENEKVLLVVDFVEFTDGTTWGADTYNFAELLKGKRSGIDAASKHFLKVLEQAGVRAVVNTIEAGETELVIPEGHSTRWEEGFREGLGFVSRRLKRALKKDGFHQVEFELRRMSKAPDRR